MCAAHGCDLEYQPQVDLRALRVTDFQALLRWRHPVRGNGPPAAFIRLAEELGLVGDIDQWVWKRACQEAMDRPDDVGVAVNISAVQLTNVAFPSVLAAALIASGLRILQGPGTSRATLDLVLAGAAGTESTDH